MRTLVDVMKPTIKINSRNKYHNELWMEGRLVANGNNGLENVEIKTMGKRTSVVLTLTGVNIIIKDTECPEAHRYDQILERFGDRSKLSELNLICDMIKISPTACDGCPYKPDEAKSSPRSVHSSRSPVG